MEKLLLILSLLSAQVFAGELNYYPKDLLTKIKAHSLQNAELRKALFEVVSGYHKKVPGSNDVLGCQLGTVGCYTHTPLSYSDARKKLFGELHLEKNNNGSYYIKDVYCHKTFTTENSSIGPDRIPEDTKINCEHTWPQSKFTGQFPRDMQKSDLHHLFPTDSKANSTRGNYNFAEVRDNGELGAYKCQASKSGPSLISGGDNYFEPPAEHKGNVARAIFYFSVRYQIDIPNEEEDYLRKWHELDPVDDEEIARNDSILGIQGNKNPFIDFPELVTYINQF